MFNAFHNKLVANATRISNGVQRGSGPDLGRYVCHRVIRYDLPQCRTNRQRGVVSTDSGPTTRRAQHIKLN